MHEDLAFHSLSELSALLSSRRTSSREIVDACLARIAALDSHLHAFVDVYADTARASLSALVADWSPDEDRASTTRSRASPTS